MTSLTNEEVVSIYTTHEAEIAEVWKRMPEVTTMRGAVEGWLRNEVARWHDDANHRPTEPGVYYMESCDQYGNPLPGLMYWEPGKPWEQPSRPTKYFGPIPNAMQPWPMTTTEAS